jgi:hypothetical protein
MEVAPLAAVTGAFVLAAAYRPPTVVATRWRIGAGTGVSAAHPGRGGTAVAAPRPAVPSSHVDRARPARRRTDSRVEPPAARRLSGSVRRHRHRAFAR